MKVTIEEHRAIVDDFVAFMAGGDQRFAKELNARMREASAAMDYEAAAVYRDRLQRDRRGAAARARSCWRRTRMPTSSASPRTSSSAAVQQFVIRGGRVRGVRGDDDREGARHLAAASSSTRSCSARTVTRRPPTSRARCWCPRCPTMPPTSRSGCASAAASSSSIQVRAARRKARAAEDGDAQRAAGAHDPQDPAHAATTSPARRRSPTCRRRSASPRRRCGSSATTSRTSAAPTSSPRWSSSRTACRAKTSTARSACPRRPTTPIRSTRCSRGASRTWIAPKTRTSPSAEPDRRTARSHDPQAPRFAYPPQLLVVDGGKPQVEAAARALADAGHQEIALCGIAKRLEEVWMPGEDYPVILPRTARRCSSCSVCATRRTASRSRTSGRRRKRDIRACSPRSRASARRASRRCSRHFGSVSRLSSARLAEEIAEVPGVGPTLAAAIRRAPDEWVG